MMKTDEMHKLRAMLIEERAEKETMEIARMSEKINADEFVPVFSDSQVLQHLEKSLEILRNSRPHKRGEKSRAYAVCITDMEKVMSYFKVMVSKAEDD